MRHQDINHFALDSTISSLYSTFITSTGVCTDTRTLQQGEIFFALKGPNFNGNKYAAKALSEGASYAVIDEAEFKQSDQYILVEDVLVTLQKLASHHRHTFDIPVLGITGSNGKTTTKEIASRVLSSTYQVHFTQGNLNNHIGVPLTLLRMPRDTEFAIIEMGANHVGDIAELCTIAEPTHGLITNIGDAHIGEFGGRENLIRAKSELFDFLRKTGGVPFINTEDIVLNNMSKRFKNAVLYPDTSCKLVGAKPFVHYLDEHDEEHSTEMIGTYNFLNISASVAVGKYFKVERPYRAIDSYVPDNNRSQVMEIGSNKIILDAYNANPSSMEAALKNLHEMTGDKKVALLGEMKEMGDYADQEHLKIVSLTKQLGIETYWVGEHFLKILDDSDRGFEQIELLILYLEENPFQGVTVLVKGSRSTHMEKITQSQAVWM